VDIQNQKTEEGSFSLQAGGNITINDYTQIKEIFNDLFRLNFPDLVREATEKAQINLEKYLLIFISNLSENDRVRVQENLKNPESQFLLNDSIQSAARYGNKIDLNLLSDAIKNALISEDDLLTRLFSFASEIIPKLTKQQMLFILVVFYIHNLGFREDIINAFALEMMTMQCFKMFPDFERTTDAYKMHLVSLGVFTSNHFAGDTAQSLLERKYPNKFNSDIKPALNSGKMPFLKKIMDYYDENQLVKYPITPIGSAIGFLLIRLSIPDISANILKEL
jgi:hypothetical protein